MPELQVLTGPLQWKTVRLEGSRFLIGRKDGCHLVLKDGWVSREHTVIIEPQPGEFHVQDLDSENGTYLNAERIRERVMKHGDILRVGRTEMRFVLRATAGDPAFPPQANVPPPPPAASPAPGPADAPKPARVFDMTQTVIDSRITNGPPSDTPRIDLRERVRRLESRLHQLEEDNAAFAAENAVLKRNFARMGLLDRTTGQVDVSRLTPQSRPVVPESLVPFISNPSAHIAFPTPDGGAVEPETVRPSGCPPGVLKVGILGIDGAGQRLAEAFARLGYLRNVVVVCERDSMRGGMIEPEWRLFVDVPERARGPADHPLNAVLPRIEEVCASAFAGACDLVFICCDLASPLAADAVSMLAGVIRGHGVRVGALVLIDDTEAGREPQKAGRAAATWSALRAASDAGTVGPVIAAERSRFGASASGPGRSMDDSVAGVCDALLRLPAMPGLVADWEPSHARECLLEQGFATMGRAASKDAGEDALERCARHAITKGAMCGLMPASRARSAFVFGMVGSEILAKEPAAAGRLESALERVSGDLPQARRLRGVYQDAGRWVRTVAFLGGQPFPETPWLEREKRR